MAFAIFYNIADLNGLRDGITNPLIPQADKGLALSCWNAGVSGFATAPLTPNQFRCVMTPAGQVCDPNCRIVVVDGKHTGQTITLAQFRALLVRLAVSLQSPILDALADDMSRSSGAVEPWPQV